MEDLILESQPVNAGKDGKGKAKAPKIHHVTDQEWVALIVNQLKRCFEDLSNVLCVGKYANPETLHRAYTHSVVLNPLFCSREAAQKCDKESRMWISNIQGIGDDVKNYKALLENCMAQHRDYGPYFVVVLTDNPQEALRVFNYPYQPLIVSPVPVPGHRGTFNLRCRNREYTYFFNCDGRTVMEYDTDMLSSHHHIFSTHDHLDKIAVNFKNGALYEAIIKVRENAGRCEPIPIQYLDTRFKLTDHQAVTVPNSGVPQISGLVEFYLQLMPETLVYNPVEMKETSLHAAASNPLFTASIGYEETVKFYQSLGLTFPDNAESRERIKRHAEEYVQQTVPMIKPTGDQLLAYYKPGFYTAQKDFSITLGKKKVLVFAKGKDYYIYPVQHSEVLELPEVQLLDASSKNETSRMMTLHCTYTALSLTSELKTSEIQTYNSDEQDKYKVITAEEYELARKIQQALAMGNNKAADDLKQRLGSQHGRRLHITSKDPNLAKVLDVFPPPEVKTLSEMYPAQLKQRISMLKSIGAKLTDVQMLHAALASLKRGVVFTHNVGSGKTRIAAYAAIISGAKRIAFIAKSKILGEIMKELRDELGVDVTHIHSAGCIRRLREEIRQEALERRKAVQAAIAEKKPVPQLNRKPRFYIISQEFLTIGGLANQTFDPYVVDVTEVVGSSPNAPVGGGTGNTGERIHTLRCTRENAEKQIKDQILQLRADGVITGNVKRIPFRFSQHVRECPKCMEAATHKMFSISDRKRWIDLTCATRTAIREQVVDYVKRGKIEVGLREFGTFSRHGHCRVCGYLARSYQRVQEQAPEDISEEVSDLLAALGEEEKSLEKGQKLERGFSSALQFPAYRLLKDMFDCKICDEAHSLTGESMVYEAVSSIHTRKTYLLSGTLLRRTPAEMWQVFSLLWGYRAPEFPYAHDQQTEFVEQHVTYRVTRETVRDQVGKKVSTKHQRQEMPEPANAPKLWKFLHQAQLHATNKSMGLKIPEVKRHFLEIPLEGDALAAYDAKLNELRNSYVNRPAVFSLQQRADWFTRINELQTVSLKAKLGQLLPIVHEFGSTGRNLIIACKQQKTYESLVEQLNAEGLDFVKLDEKRPAQPHKRREWLDEHYVKSKKPILLTRTPLINESLNNLVKASAIIVVEAEYVFYPLQQLEGRIARPKQKAPEVDVVYMVTHHPSMTSIDEAMLQMALRRNNANIELVSGNVTQRTNEQLVEMAETQKMREMELMQTLLAEAKPVQMDYNAEFIAREAEIEEAEKSKAVIVVDNTLRKHLEDEAKPLPVASDSERARTVTVPKRTEAPVELPVATAVVEAPASPAKVVYATEGDNLILPLNVPYSEPQPKVRIRNRLERLKRAVAELKGEPSEMLLFPEELMKRA